MITHDTVTVEIYIMFSNLKIILKMIFKMHSLKANLSKFQFLVLRVNNISLLSLIVTNKFILCSGKVELMGKTMLIKLNLLNFMPFKRRYFTFEKTKFMTEFLDSQFNYAPLKWMFADKTLINKILKIHHRSLQLIYRQ